MRAFFPLIAASAILTSIAAAGPVSRPPIGNIANFVVKTGNLDEARKFYSGVLGYDEVFLHQRAITDAVKVAVFKVNDRPPTPQQLGVWHHVCVGTLDMPAVYKTVSERGYKPPREPSVARDGRLLLQLYDKNNTRTEVMIRKPVQKPCCSENMDPYIK